MFEAKAILPVPEKFNIFDAAGETIISWRWFRGTHIFLFLFSIFWFGFLFFWYSLTFAPQSTDNPAIWLFRLFPIGHVAVGCWIFYKSVCGFLNSTKLILASTHLTVRHGPLPWRGNQTIAVQNIDQVYVKKIIMYRRQSALTAMGIFNLCYMDKSQKEKILLKELEDTEAIFLEQQIKKRFGMSEKEVLGAYKFT